MKPQCIQAVEAHLSAIHGVPKKLTSAAIARIDDRMREGAKVLARRDRTTWSGMSADERTVAIGRWVGEQEKIAADATARSQLRQLSAVANKAREMNELAAARGDKSGKWGKAVIDVLEGVDNTLRGAEQVAMRGFGELMKGAEKGSVFDFASTKSDNFFADVVREIYGTNTGNAPAAGFASQWSGNMEGYRQARNRAGGTVGTVENYAPQTHDITIMQRQGKSAWGDFMMSNLDRTKYLDENGAQLNDADLRAVVDKMYDTLTTDGANKITLDSNGLAESVVGGGSSNLAKRLNTQHREIHFKDADAVVNYNQQFSDRSMGATFFDHMLRNARETAMINELGPNPDMTYATLRDTARVRDGKMPGAKFNKDGSVQGASRAGMTPDGFYRQMAGGHDVTVIDDISSGLTAWAAATKLTSTALRAPFQDTPGVLLNMADTGQLGKIGSIMRTAFSPKEAARFGIGAEVAASEARYGADRMISQGRVNVGNAISRYAQATMRYTGLDAWTRAARRAGQTTHALALGEWSHINWGALDEGQRGLLNNAGILEADWAHIESLPRQQLRGHDIHDINDVNSLGLDPDAAMQLQSKILSFVRMGGDIVTSEHNLTAATIMSLGGRTNALTKQVMLFKNAGAVQTAHMFDRYSRARTAGKVGYFAAQMGMGVGFGYTALVAQALVAGQNPPPLNDWRTIGKAMAVTGGFAMVQDLITSMYDAVSGDNAGHSSSAVPLFGDIATLAKIGMTAATGDGEKAGYMAIKFARNQVAPLNYWYAKAAVDHLFFNDAAEALNPGYNTRLRSYADQKGQQYFWDPQGGAGADVGIGYYNQPKSVLGE